MLAEYDNYVLADAGLGSSDMDAGAGAVCSSSTGHPDASSSYLYGWHEAQDDAYTLTELGDAGGDAGGGAPPPPPAYFPDQDMQSLGLPCGMPAWGTEPWQQHGPAHAGNPFDDDAVTGSDGSSASSPERRCVRSLLHVALQRGGGFAQKFTSCGVPPLPAPLPAPPCYPGVVKQEALSPSPMASPGCGVLVSSTSLGGSLGGSLGSSLGSPRPVTPADSLRSCYSPASPFLLAPLQQCDDAVVSTTSASSCFPQGDALAGLTPGPFSPLPPPSYPVFRTPYPTPSPDPCYPQRLDPFPGSLAPLPLPLHMMSSTPTPAPPTPTSRSAKRRRNRKPPQPGAAPPRKRERSERQLHPCKLCDKRFKDNYSVNVHMRTHTGEKPFPCIVCGKMFRQKAHLAKHRSTHQPAEWAAATAAATAAANAHLPAGTTIDQAHQAMMGMDTCLDGNSNSVPMWAEGKCKAPNVWTPSIMSPALTS